MTVYEIRFDGKEQPLTDGLPKVIATIIARTLGSKREDAESLATLDITENELKVLGRRRRRYDKAKDVLGSGPVKPAEDIKPDAVLTLRRDLLGIRGALIADDSNDALRRVDYTLDMIDNYLAES